MCCVSWRGTKKRAIPENKQITQTKTINPIFVMGALLMGAFPIIRNAKGGLISSNQIIPLSKLFGFAIVKAPLSPL
jgi:hypothetical protein